MNIKNFLEVAPKFTSGNDREAMQFIQHCLSHWLDSIEREQRDLQLSDQNPNDLIDEVWTAVSWVNDSLGYEASDYE